MSIYAALGYAAGVILFAIGMRIFRKRLIEKRIRKGKNKNNPSHKEND